MHTCGRGPVRVLEIAFLPNGLPGCLRKWRLPLSMLKRYPPNLKGFQVKKNPIKIVFFCVFCDRNFTLTGNPASKSLDFPGCLFQLPGCPRDFQGHGTSSRVRKNDYVLLGTYQNINLENFGRGPVQYF